MSFMKDIENQSGSIVKHIFKSYIQTRKRGTTIITGITNIQSVNVSKSGIVDSTKH